MLWIEMSRDVNHGGGDWGFRKCIWCPTVNREGGKQGWWEKHRDVRAGDRVLHLRGKDNNAAFVGVSTCSSDVSITSLRPPDPGEWDYATHFYRTPLSDFQDFDAGIPLRSIFNQNETALRDYFIRNSEKQHTARRRLFYVIQAGHLQCQNGAYLSESDEELSQILLRTSLIDAQVEPTLRVAVSERIATVAARVGQDYFSAAVKDNYKKRCCFPDCGVDDDRFLIGAHIARWSDAPHLRGELSNGLCFCLTHDRAFEIGLFTIDDFQRIRVLSRAYATRWSKDELLAFDGEQIRTGDVLPSDEALLHHWERVGF